MMVHKIIKSDEDHQKTLLRIDELMDAAPNTPEGDELELLVTLVELYEDIQYPVLNEPNQKLPEEIPEVDWTCFPINEMMNRGWIPDKSSIKGNEEDIIRSYIEVAGGMNRFSQLAFRKSSSLEKKYKTNKYALMAWCLRVLELSQKNPVEKKYKPESFKLSDLAKLSYFDNGPLLAKEFLEKHGIQLIALTLRYDRTDNFWFCLLQELAHLIKHISIDENNIIIDELEQRPLKKKFDESNEQEADLMAQNALIPQKYWDSVDLEAYNLAKEVIHISEQLKIHPSIVAGRIRFEKNNCRLLNQFVRNNKVSSLFN